MIKGVLDHMREIGLLSERSRVNFNAHIRLDNVLLNVFDESGRYYYVRLAEAYDLEPEYRIAVTVGQAFDRYVPRALDFVRDGAVTCIVMEGIRSELVTGDDLLAAQPQDLLARELVASLAHARKRVAVAGKFANIADIVRQMDARYAGTEQDDVWQRVKDVTDLAGLSRLVRQPQHGDFVPNNFGLRRDSIVIFDWEDFGKIDVPGFDLNVLLGAIVDFDPVRLRDLRLALLTGASPAPVPWFDGACQCVGIDRDLLLHAMPFHLALFLWLKDRYSPAIRRKVQMAIEGLL